MPSVPTELERWTRTKHPKEHQSGCNTAVTSLNTKLELANYPGKWSIKAGRMSEKTTNHFPVAIRLQPGFLITPTYFLNQTGLQRVPGWL